MVMLKRIAAPLALVVALACAGPVLAADPTVDQVYQAARAGHLDEAQQLMDQVLKDHPNSAKAHYVEAELSARAGNLAPGSDGTGYGAAAGSQRRVCEAGSARGAAERAGGSRRHSAAPRATTRPHRGPLSALVLPVADHSAGGRRRGDRLGSPARRAAAVPAISGFGTASGRRAWRRLRWTRGLWPGGLRPARWRHGLGYRRRPRQRSRDRRGCGGGRELVHHFTDRDGNRVEAPPGYVPPPDENSNMGGNDFGVSDGGNSWDDNGGSFGAAIAAVVVVAATGPEILR